jgi:CRP/FNR family cyclic AMP-dependent transcriptional regulator
MHETFADHWLTQGLPGDAKSALYDIGDVVDVSPDDTIIEADEPNQFMYLLLEGAYKVYLPKRPGRDHARTLGHRGPGDLLGEYSFVDSFQPTARVTASTPGLMFRVGHKMFRKWLDSDADIGSIVYRNILSYLVVRLRAQDEELACLLF